MPEAARGNGQDSVSTNHGCAATTVSDQCSAKVFVNGIGVVRNGDLNASHTVLVPGPACVPHQVPLTSFSSKVFADGLNCGRKGDDYTGETITSGSPDVYFGG